VRVTLTKHHGLGNDFLVLFDDQPLPPLPLGVIAQRWCHRRQGIGADGLLVALTRPEADADVGMALFNADGSRAEMSGNGIRCLVQAWAHRNDLAEGEARIATDAGLKVVGFGPGPDRRTIVASVAMGTAEPIEAPEGWAETGIDPMRPCLHLSLGNPHSVVAVDDVEAVDLAPLGKQVPDVNLEIVAPLEGRHELRMRVHERGAGITEACGTGAVAAAVAASRWGLAVPDDDGEILVRMDGGDAKVRFAAGGELVLTGPSTYIATIETDA
jgi:diaminopimelate epimerase